MTYYKHHQNNFYPQTEYYQIFFFSDLSVKIQDSVLYYHVSIVDRNLFQFVSYADRRNHSVTSWHNKIVRQNKIQQDTIDTNEIKSISLEDKITGWKKKIKLSKIK